MIKKIKGVASVLFWFFSGASIVYPEMTRWEIAKRIWREKTS